MTQCRDCFIKNRNDVGGAYKSGDQIKLRSMALAYAKDLVVAERINVAELGWYVECFVKYMNTGDSSVFTK